MDFYKIIKTIVNDKLSVPKHLQIDTNKFFNDQTFHNFPKNSSMSNEDYIIHGKRQRFLQTNQK